MSHVGGGHPWHDMMTGVYAHNTGSPGTHLHGVSNLDNRGIEGSFARVMGQPSSLWGKTGTVLTTDYQKTSC